MHHLEYNHTIAELPLSKVELPSKVTEIIETVPEIQQALEPESSGLNWYQGIGIVALVVIVAAAIKKYGCCKKK